MCLQGANTYSGGTTLNGGALGIGVDSAVCGGGITSGALGSGTLTVVDGTLIVPYYAIPQPHTLANNIVIKEALTIGSGNDLTLNGVISGAGTLTQDIC